MTNNSESTPVLGLPVAALPFGVMLLLFVLGTLFSDSGNSVIVVSILGATFAASVIAVWQGKTWDDVQGAAAQKLAGLFPALLILLAIGGLIGSWVLSGTIPYFVAVGLRLVDPDTFVLTAFVATALMSVMTGTSWGSAGTIGVAMMGMASALNAPLEVVAGAVVSGSYFGDKLSPLSDTTNVAAIAAGANLYGHIRHMLYTAVPSFVAAGVVYSFVTSAGDAQSSAGLPEAARTMLRDIDLVYAQSWMVLIPPAAILAAIALRISPVLGIVSSTVVALIVGVVVQDFSVVNAVDAAMNGFSTEMIDRGSVSVPALSAPFQTLVSRGGIYSMVSTLVIVFSAILLTGAMEVSGALNLIVNRLIAIARSVFGLIAATMASGLLMISLSSHASVTALIVGNLFQRSYADKKLAPENLSRSIEDSVTLIDPILPWTVSGVFMATTLGVPTLEYLPWAIFCLGGPFFSLVYAKFHRQLRFGIKPLVNGA
jgi:NhaC family Na+:H+ antiporter